MGPRLFFVSVAGAKAPVRDTLDAAMKCRSSTAEAALFDKMPPVVTFD